MKELESFINKNPPKRRVSKLFNFKKQIFYLYNNGHQVEQIIEYLKTQKIKVSKDALYKFMRKNKDNELIKNETVSKIEKVEKEEKPVSKAYQKFLEKTKEI